jgi:diguanylate cyclase (GGDEF)-like protein
MSRRSYARPGGGREVLGLFPDGRVRRSVELTPMTSGAGKERHNLVPGPGGRATSGAYLVTPGDTRGGVSAIGRSARSWRAALPSVGVVALVGGLFGPWLSSSYFGVGRVSAGVVDLPGGTVYAAVVAVFVIGAICGGARYRPSRVALLVMAAGLAAYSAFWLLGGLVLDLSSGFSIFYPSFGSGALLSLIGSVLSVLVVGGSARPTFTTEQDDEGNDLILPNETDGRSSELASCEEFLDRLRARSNGGEAHESVPLVFVRLDGMNEVRVRYGSPAADRVMVAMAHRLRAHLRRDDTVVRFLPTEVFILLSGEVSEENVLVVVRRLKAALAMPIPSVKRRHAKLVKVTVEVVRAQFTNGRFQVMADGERLIDAPVATGNVASGVDGLGPPPLRSPGNVT